MLIEAGAFSSDRHAILGQLSWHKLDPEETLIELAPRAGEETLRIEDIEAKIEELRQRARARALARRAVPHRPGLRLRAHHAGCARRRRAIAGFDMAHAIGNLPLQLHDWDVDFAVWCSYKYLNAGSRRHRRVLRARARISAMRRRDLSGWWGHEPQTRFQMAPEFRPADRRRRLGREQPAYLLGRAAARLARDVPRRRHRRAARQVRAPHAPTPMRLLRERVGGDDAQIITPEAPRNAAASSACVVSGGPRRGRRIFDALGDHGIVCDWREPDVIRIAPAPLYNRFIDIFDFVDELAAALKEIA